MLIKSIQLVEFETNVTLSLDLMEEMKGRQVIFLKTPAKLAS